MKFMLVTTLFFASSMAIACPNFSGNYFLPDEHGKTTLTVKQTGCELMAYSAAYVPTNGDPKDPDNYEYITDDLEHDEDLQPIQGKGTYTSLFYGEKFIVTRKYVNEGSGYILLRRITFISDLAGNLIVVLSQFDSNGQSGKTQANFEKSPNSQ